MYCHGINSAVGLGYLTWRPLDTYPGVVYPGHIALDVDLD